MKTYLLALAACIGFQCFAFAEDWGFSAYKSFQDAYPQYDPIVALSTGYRLEVLEVLWNHQTMDWPPRTKTFPLSPLLFVHYAKHKPADTAHSGYRIKQYFVHGLARNSATCSHPDVKRKTLIQKVMNPVFGALEVCLVAEPATQGKNRLNVTASLLSTTPAGKFLELQTFGLQPDEIILVLKSLTTLKRIGQAS